MSQQRQLPLNTKAAFQLSSGLQREQEIYVGAAEGKKLSIPIPLPMLEEKAREMLDGCAYDYVAGGAGGERTMHANLEAFYRWRIVPRMLRNVSQRDLSVEILGMKLPAPVLLGPIGVQGIIHQEGEMAAARAAASLGLPFTLSTVSSYSIEDVAKAMGDAPRWFQLYWGKKPELTVSMVQRAERAGYKAIVVTLDTSLLAWRERDLERGYLPFFRAQGLANYFTDAVFCSCLPQAPQENPLEAVRLWSSLFSNSALTWEDLAFLRKHTILPIVLKGILHPEDAQSAVEHGVNALIVSNHGGRQVDGAIAALDALPGIVQAVKNRIPVLFDSGIRRGSDAIKALALGAKAVLVGRLFAWGLAVAGEQGVRDVMQNFLADLDLTLALSGYTCLEELSPSTITHAQ